MAEEKETLIIKIDAMITKDVQRKLHKEIVDQLKTGVVLIPAFYEVELVKVPEDVEVKIVSEEIPDDVFLTKRFHMPI